jgi:5-methylcytosine-specific restriction endonuclease McrA
MGYAKLLQRNEWKIKCSEILQRDHFMCQDCGKIGLQNNIYFPFSDLNDITYFFPKFPINDLYTYCNEIENRWSTIKGFEKIKYDKIEQYNQSYIYTFRPFGFLSTGVSVFSYKSIKLNQYIKHQRLDISLKCKLHDVKGVIFAYLFEELGNKNFIQLNYYDNIGNIDLLFTLRSQVFKIELLNPSFPSPNPLYNLKLLNVHHKYYINGHMPWEYNNDSLITLCNECHQKRHLR